MYSQPYLATMASFQLTAARRRLPMDYLWFGNAYLVSTHSRSKAAAFAVAIAASANAYVSTHSRSKAAAKKWGKQHQRATSFNSQPLEGGCAQRRIFHSAPLRFQLTAARRRLQRYCALAKYLASFNSQPLEGGCPLTVLALLIQIEFQLTAARRRLLPGKRLPGRFLRVSTHSRSKAAAHHGGAFNQPHHVSTHSRSKAAAAATSLPSSTRRCFNSQPLEGGCAKMWARFVMQK